MLSIRLLGLIFKALRNSSMTKKIKILHLEDSLNDSELIHSIIENGEIRNEYFLVENEIDFINILKNKKIDIILSDYSLPDYNGNEALKVAREKYSDIPFIFVSGAMGEDAAIDAMLNGATDYVLKNKLERLVPAIKRALHEFELERKRKQSVMELLEKEVQYHNLADSGLALIWTSGTDKLYNYFNKPWLNFTGRTLEQEMAFGWTEGVHPEDLDKCLNIYIAAFDKHEKFDIEYRLRNKRGGYRWIQMLASPNYNSNREFIGYIGHCFDITEHKHAEDALKESEVQFKSIFKDAPMGIALIDSLTGNIQNVNPKFAKIAGRTIEEMVNKNWMSITHPDDIQLDLNNMTQLLAGKINGFNIEKRYILPDGSFVWINMTVSQILYEDKSHPRHLCMIEDISKRKRAEKELVIANRGLVFQNEEKEKREN
jgi:PAS domain S-box-containing protein